MNLEASGICQDYCLTVKSSKLQAVPNGDRSDKNYLDACREHLSGSSLKDTSFMQLRKVK